jgi:hypothetical protein
MQIINTVVSKSPTRKESRKIGRGSRINVFQLPSGCPVKMIVRPTSDLTRRVINLCSKVRFASTKTKKTPRTKPVDPDHGQHIYVYHQFQTNQVVYSLSKALKVFAFFSIIPWELPMLISVNSKEQCFPPTTTVQRQEDRPACPTKRSLGPSRIDILPARRGAGRALCIPEAP